MKARIFNMKSVLQNIQIDMVELPWWSFPVGISEDTFTIATRISVASTGAATCKQEKEHMRVLTLAQAVSDVDLVSSSPQR